MRRLAQFVRLLASRVCLFASVSRLFTSRVPYACVCVCSRLRLASVCVCSRVCMRLSYVCVRLSSVCSRLSHVGRLISRLYASRVCVCLRLSARVCVYVRLCASIHVKGSECSRLCASVCVCSRQGFRMRASVSRLCASMCVCVCVRLLMLKGSECSRLCASGVGRLVSRASVLVNACGNWLILCVGRHSKSLKGGGRFLLSSYYLSPCLLSYNVPMPKYPSHHLIYVFYHPMPIMPLY